MLVRYTAQHSTAMAAARDPVPTHPWTVVRPLIYSSTWNGRVPMAASPSGLHLLAPHRLTAPPSPPSPPLHAVGFLASQTMMIIISIVIIIVLMATIA